MVRSRVFGLLAITLCLVVCISANTKATELDAIKAVRWARANTKKWLGAIQKQYNKAEALSNELTTYKERAENAAIDAEKTAQMYPKAQATAAKVKTASDKVLKHVALALVKATAALQYTERSLIEFEALDKMAQDKAFAVHPNNDYWKVKFRSDKFTDLILEKGPKMDSGSEKLISAAASAQKGIPEHVETTLLAKYHVDCIAAVSKSETLLEGAKKSIPIMEKNKAEIEATAKGIHKLYKQASEKLKVRIFALQYATEADMKLATSDIEKAKDLQKEIVKQKQEADDALEKVQTATKTEDAKRDAATAAGAADEVEKQAEEIKKKVEAVKTSAADAISLKQDAEELLKKDTIDITKEDPPAEGSTDESADWEGDGPEWDSAKSPVNGGTMSIMGASSISTMSLILTLLLALITCATLH